MEENNEEKILNSALKDWIKELFNNIDGSKLLVQKTDQEDPNSNYAVFVGYIFRD